MTEPAFEPAHAPQEETEPDRFAPQAEEAAPQHEVSAATWTEAANPLEVPKTEQVAPRPMKKILTAAAVLVGLAFGGFFLLGGPDSDDLSKDEIQARQQHYDAELAAGHVVLPTFNLSDPRQVQAAKTAIATMPLDQDAKTAMIAQVEQQAQTAPESRTVDYVVFQAYDNCYVDGDTITFRAPGIPDTTIVLAKNFQTVVIPKPVGQTITVKVIGVHDGGGGITAGINTVFGPLAIPVMPEGAVIPLTVR